MNNKKTDVTFLIPLLDANEESLKSLDITLKSISEIKTDKPLKCFLSVKTDDFDSVNAVIEKYTALTNFFLKVFKDDTNDIFAVINNMVSRCTTKYFSVTEPNGFYMEYLLNVFDDFASKKGDLDIFLPIIENTKNNSLLSFSNEIAWSPSFANDELGYIDLKQIQDYKDFNLFGSFIKTERFISLGGFDASLKICSPYNLLLKAAQADLKIYVLPKILYSLDDNEKTSTYIGERLSTTEEDGVKLLEKALEIESINNEKKED